MRIVLVGGGTGGHFYPLLATAKAVRETRPNVRLYYLGPDAYDASLLQQENIEFVKIPAGKLRRYFSVLNFFDLFKVMAGVIVCFFKLFWIMPDVIFSKGGYTSMPVLIMARWYRIPVVIHESDSVPGRANKFAKKQARFIGISFPETAQYFPAHKTAIVGIPIRKEILNPPADPFAALGIPNDVPLIYVTGGSLGAERLNTMILDTLQFLLPYYRIYHQTGPDNYEDITVTAKTLLEGSEFADRYYITGTANVDTVSALEAAASLIISRAGSTTITEISLHGKPSIIIPIPETVSHDQRTNAYSYGRSGAATILEESNLTRNLLINEINNIMTNPELYQQMSSAASQFAPRDAAEKVAAALIRIGIEHAS